jgi:hypothetical protein
MQNQSVCRRFDIAGPGGGMIGQPTDNIVTSQWGKIRILTFSNPKSTGCENPSSRDPEGQRSHAVRVESTTTREAGGLNFRPSAGFQNTRTGITMPIARKSSGIGQMALL